MSIKEWLKYYAFNYLNTNESRYIYDLELIISSVLKIKRENILILENKIINLKNFILLDKILFFLKKGVPLPYLVKNVEFYSLKFKLNNKVFIPRSDTEVLVDFVINKLKNNVVYNIMDLGTGIGSIAISLAKNLPKSNILGIDFNNESIKFANINSKILNVKNVCFINKNWFNYKLNYKFDIIISNPPYISEYEFEYINKNKKIYEPKESLVSKYNGVYDIFYIINKFNKFLKKNGFMLIEHGYLQGKIVRKIFKYNNFTEINTFNDLNKNNRFTYAKK
ncbi:peptide chain release factor N(5)-glutamine methyltransferase [endosymbiont of Pachyrhynchus infernalis]|uniref:peptide chain release factor N(5)-glutamine methyltransferase n=1 Tax=endosymbiont of Pachyrhynchus infernalis TaxID=1971488 RepID=UPI000DC6DC25|nr:peptide chain release factor N(5)-glutamine methyltransferase [endosymbiont of Pachyrhynchus infernalis]BBA84870.1 release factor glutamine methyltransferase [endosymbiont of Pachyrhynchus infernalis]